MLGHSWGLKRRKACQESKENLQKRFREREIALGEEARGNAGRGSGTARAEPERETYLTRKELREGLFQGDVKLQWWGLPCQKGRAKREKKQLCKKEESEAAEELFPAMGRGRKRCGGGRGERDSS